MIRFKTINNKKNKYQTIKEGKSNKIKLNNNWNKALFLSKIWIWEMTKENNSKILEDLQLQRSFDLQLKIQCIYLLLILFNWQITLLSL